MSEEVYSYALFGLGISSDIPLQGVPEGLADGLEIRIRRGVLPSDLPSEPGYVETGQGTVLTVPKVGRYLIRDGRSIIVERLDSASDRNVRLFLLGSAFGALLHQRGLLPLHANAIDIGGRVIAFCGHSGAGKSTIAAWFHDRGYKVLADDVCVIALDAGPLAFPGPPRLRLWREALEASGRVVEDYDPSFDDQAKYDVPTRDAMEARPLPLDRVYMLRRAPDEAPRASFTRLRGVDAVDALVSNTYRGGYLRSIGRTRDHLMTCAQLAATVPVFSVERAWGFDCFAGQAELLERHALGPADGGAG